MKIRDGFVSNSSSASFVVRKEYLSDYHIHCILNHIKVAKEIERQTGKNIVGYYDPPWNISDDGDSIHGDTYMTNFDMFSFLEYIGVDMYRVDREHSNDGYTNDESYYGSLPYDEE